MIGTLLFHNKMLEKFGGGSDMIHASKRFSRILT